MKQVTINLYEFKELESDAKEKARHNFLERIGWDLATDDVREYYRERLRELHLPNEEVYFSLSYSQGDGMAFYGDIYSIGDVMKASGEWTNEEVDKMLDIEEKAEVTFSIKSNSHRYHNWATMTLVAVPSYEGELTEDEMKFFHRVVEWLRQYIVNVSKKLEKEGYNILDDASSDGFIQDFCENNGWMFRKDGRMEFLLALPD